LQYILIMKNNIFSIIKKTYKNPCTIKGRSSRKEYIVFLLSFFIVFYCLYFLISQKIHFIITVLTFLFLLVTAVVSFCLTIRRLHDVNFSSYWIVITIPLFIVSFIAEIKTSNSIYFDLVIFYSTIQSLLLCFFKGTKGTNRYGEPPQY
jgi:uncharacterized membrane protein YhaH (DUF805 family)|tara:strand:+ start:395 stop:841 length:447 start_codon:yes stop_codon:yes gene_type:complete